MERQRLAGYIRRPSADEIRSLAAMEYMDLTDEEAGDLTEVIDKSLKIIDRLDDLPMPQLEVKYKERDKGYRPTPEEDPYNAFIRKCLVKGAPSGKLAGKRVGVKDNLRVAGIPMSNASTLLPGYVPDIDATVIERLLDDGASIVGKLNMDEFALAATGETSVYGCPRNPHNPIYSAGGSSGGSGAAVAAGEVDIALGVDEGGSGRIPAAWCGVVSIKPTHGLVPTFGLSYMDHTLDFICPITRSVEEAARVLEVIAGDDPKDPQWVRGPIEVEEYTKALQEDISGTKLGIIEQSMDWDVSDEDVNKAVLKAVGKLESLGASLQKISFPLWKDAAVIWTGVVAHSAGAMIESDMEGYWRGGWCDVNWQDAFGKARRAGIGIPPMFKIFMVLSKYLRREYCSTYFSKAQNLRVHLTQQVDRLLDEVDVLVTPTTPMRVLKLMTEPFHGLRKIATRTGFTLQNTCPTNITGHPSLTVPCGVDENGLPVGIQLIGRRFQESTLFRVAYTLEQS